MSDEQEARLNKVLERGPCPEPDFEPKEVMVRIAEDAPTDAAPAAPSHPARKVVRVRRGDRLWIEGQIDGTWEIKRSYFLRVYDLEPLRDALTALIKYLGERQVEYTTIQEEEEE